MASWRSSFVLLSLCLALCLVLTASACKRDHTARFPPDPVGERLLELGKIEDAKDHYQDIFKKDHDNLTACMGLAAARCALKQTDKALEIFGGCIGRHPEAAVLYISRGLCEQDLPGDGPARAEADFRKALELEPPNPSAHNQLGMILQRRGETEAAIRHFEAAIAADPYSFPAHNNLGVSLLALGKYERAVAAFQKAVTLQPDLQGIHVHTNLGIAFLHLRRTGQAEAAFLMESAINPQHLPAHLYLGNLYSLSQRYPEAVDEYGRALALEPENPEALINLAATYLELGAPARALRLLHQAIEADPQSALAHHHLGAALDQLGQPEPAQAMREKAKALGFQENPQPIFPGHDL